MSNNLQFAIRIGGTKQRTGGFVPLVLMGAFPAGERNSMDSLPVISESPAYLVKHTAEAIMYRLTDRGVRAYDTETSGVLAIALCIPREAQLAGGQSPFTLLSEVYSLFRSTCMAPTMDGRYSFLDQDIDDAPFRALWEKYPLEPRPAGPYIPMSGTEVGILNVPSHHMEAFFKDTQYPEFRNYREIQIGVSCNASPGLDLLEIPRVTRYQVFENNTPTGRYLVNPFDSYESSMRDTDTISYGKLSFSLQELLEAPGFVLETAGGSARLDMGQTAIHCHIKSSEIMYKVDTDQSALSEECRQLLQKAFAEKRLALKLDGQNITDALRGGFQLRARQVLGARILQIEPDRFSSHRWRADLTSNREERSCLIKITAHPVEQPAAAPYAKRPGPSAAPKSAPQTAEPSRHAPEPAPVPQKNGLDIKSLLIGLVAGLLVGAGLMFLLKPREADDSQNQSQYQAMKDQHQKDSTSLADLQKDLTSQADTIAKLREENAELKAKVETKGKTEPAKTETKPSATAITLTPEQEKAILDAINSGESMSKIEKLPGYNSFIQKNSAKYSPFKYAVSWIVNYDSLLGKDSDTGGFKGDKKKKHDPKIARDIKAHILTSKGGGWTVQSIIDCHKDILSLMNQAEPVKQ